MKKCLWLSLFTLASCQTAPVEIDKVQDSEALVLQLAIFKTDYDTNDPEAVVWKHDSVHEFPAFKLIANENAKFDIVTQDADYSMVVTYFYEFDDTVDLGIEMQHRLKINEITYGKGPESVTTPIYEKSILNNESTYQKDKWHILGQNYSKRRGEANGSGVYFLLRVNSRSE